MEAIVVNDIATLPGAIDVLRCNHELVASAHPQRLCRQLEQWGLTSDLARRLLDCERLHRRLSALLYRRLGLGIARRQLLASLAGRIVMAGPEELRRLQRAVGAIWHADSLRRIVLGRDVRALSAWLDPEIHQLALENRGLAARVEACLCATELRDAIDDAGAMCLDAWCLTQPDALSRRLRLKLPPAKEASASTARAAAVRGPVIVRQAAARLCAHA